MMSNMGGYSKISRRLNGYGHGRGFRLSSKRFSVQRLKTRLLYLFKMLNRLKLCYGEAFQSLKKGIKMKRNNSSKRRLVVKEVSSSHNCKKPSFYRSNSSFYSEAIADCLEFIKRSSLSVDQQL